MSIELYGEIINLKINKPISIMLRLSNIKLYIQNIYGVFK